MRYMKEEMKGHFRMWAELAKKHGSMTSQHPVSREVWEYMGSTDQEHQFRHRDLMVKGIEHGRYNESIPVQAGDFDYLSSFEYTTRLTPFGIAGSGSVDTDVAMQKQGWERRWADHTDNGSFIVYRRLRTNTIQPGAIL